MVVSTTAWCSDAHSIDILRILCMYGCECSMLILYILSCSLIAATYNSLSLHFFCHIHSSLPMASSHDISSDFPNSSDLISSNKTDVWHLLHVLNV